MHKYLSIAIVAAAAISTADADACTSLIAGPGATDTGSSMITYAADSHTLYGALYKQDATDHRPGAMRKVVEWDTGRLLGEIPEAEHTYATIGNMNEHGLTIAESTWGGREELEGSGLIDYGSLIYITLQRAKTAREAVDIMTGLVRDYGYASSGESFSIADPSEVWLMELIGKGKADKGAVWVARRVPDGHISGHANHARIHTFPLDDPETLYSPDVISFARKQGYFKGKDKDFDFSKAYAVTDAGALRGCDARVWSYFNRFAPEGSMDAYLPWILEGKGEPLPLWVKPAKKLSASDLKWMMRDHFEGTPFDMTNDIGAGPYHVPYRWRPMDYEVDGKNYCMERAIATQQTGWSFVSQSRNWLPDPVGGILWFGTDDTNTSVYMPFYCGMTEIPAELAHGDINTFDPKSNFWMTNIVANQAYNRYDQMIPDIRKVQNRLEDKFRDSRPDRDKELAAMVKAGQMAAYSKAVNAEGAAVAKEATDDYRDLAIYLFVKYMDGNMKKTDADGNFQKSEYGLPLYPSFPGYDKKYYENIVKETGDHFRLPKE